MTVDRLLVKLLTAAVNDIFTSKISDEHTGYSGVTTRAFFQHITDKYCDIDEAALTNNQKKLYEPYHPNLPIESLQFQSLESVAFAEAGNSPISDTKILVAAVASVTAYGIFL